MPRGRRQPSPTPLAPLLCPGLDPGLDDLYETHFRTPVSRDYYSGAEMLELPDRQALSVVSKAMQAVGYISDHDRALVRVLRFLEGKYPPPPPPSPDPETVQEFMLNVYLAQSREELHLVLARGHTPPRTRTDNDLIAQCLLLDGTDRLLELFLPGLNEGRPVAPAVRLADCLVAETFLNGGWKMPFDPDDGGNSRLHRLWRYLRLDDYEMEPAVHHAILQTGRFDLLRRLDLWPSPHDEPVVHDYPAEITAFPILVASADEDPEIRAWLTAAMLAWPSAMADVFAELDTACQRLWCELATVELARKCRPDLPHWFAMLLCASGDDLLVPRMKLHPQWGEGVPFAVLMDEARMYVLYPAKTDKWKDQGNFFKWLTPYHAIDMRGAAAHRDYLKFVVHMLEVGGGPMMIALAESQPLALTAGRAVCNFSDPSPMDVYDALTSTFCLHLEWETFMDKLFAWETITPFPLPRRLAFGRYEDMAMRRRHLTYLQQRGARLSWVLLEEMLEAIAEGSPMARILDLFLAQGLVTREAHGDSVRVREPRWAPVLNARTAARLRACAGLDVSQ